MGITIDGIVSGLDTESIVKGLLEIQQIQLDRIELKRADVLAEKGAFQNLEAQLLTFRSKVSALAKIQNNPFERKTASVSDESVLSASVGPNAANGVYRLTVNSVAKAHQVASQGYADADSEITQGTLEVRTGAGDLTTITIDSSNNTLNGLAEAINSSDSDVSASIIRDASGGASPYKLLLTSKTTGSENAITVTNNLGASSGDAVQTTFDFGNPVQNAENAEITLGSGPGAISVESSSNRFNNLIDGVSLDIFNVSDGDEITLSIGQDNTAAIDAVDDFVQSFNAVMTYIDDQSRYDEGTDESGLLIGNRSVINIQQKLRDAVVSVVPGVNRDSNRLSALGISVTDKGQLQLNKGELTSVLNGDDKDISRADLKRLFSLDAQSSNSKISFVLGSSKTQAPSDPIQVDLTQAAERASVTASSALAVSTVIDSSNRTLEIEIDGTEATITLDEGTYTQQELTNHLESLINGASALKGRTVNVGLSSGSLTITSEEYGKSSTVKISGGTSLTDIGFTAGTEDNGRDVAGTFIINGVTESATGRGQLLSGNAGNEFTADLQLRVKLVPSEIVSGPEADLTVTRGIAASLDSILNGLLDPVDGGLKTIENGLDEQAESFKVALARQQDLFNLQEESLIRQFVALESALSQLNSTSDFLSTQLASLQSSSQKK